MTIELDHESPTYRRATNAGWTFSDATVSPEPRTGPEKNIALGPVRIEGALQWVWSPTKPAAVTSITANMPVQSFIHN